MSNGFRLEEFNRDLDKIKGNLSEELHSVLEEIRKQVVNLDTNLKDVNKIVEQKETELKGKDTHIAQLKGDLEVKINEIEKLENNLQIKTKEHYEALKNIQAYKAELSTLTSEYTKIKELYDAIKTQKQRPVATPTQISFCFKEAMEAMRNELKTSEDAPSDYVISKFDISLKTGIGIDEENKVSFQLPKEEEITNPENLSTVQFSIKSVPKVKE